MAKLKLTPTAKLLSQLISIPSVNPVGDPGTTQTGEKALAQYLGHYLKEAGAQVKITHIEKNRPNVLAVFPCKSRKPVRRILLAPHSDTVSVSGMRISPFQPKVTAGKLYGRGASDTKGSIAAMLTALKNHFSEGFKSQDTEVSFISLMGEEAGNVGAFAHTKVCPKYDLVIVGEPTDLRIVYAHKGALWLRITTKGKACHASMPHEGENAIEVMSRVINFLKKELGDILEAKSNAHLGTSTMSIGTIQGGSKINIVPDTCSIELDFRLIPEFPHKEFVKILRTALKVIDSSIKLEIIASCPISMVDPQKKIITEILPACRGVAVSPWFSDAGIYNLKKIPAIALGPGSIKQAHTADEYIRLTELEAGTRCFTQILKTLAP
ncbi:MAG: M20 family metallopeptidase [Verrucomicrobiota bacterium]